MTIKQQGGIFGRNPTFNDVEAKDITSENLVVNSNSSDAGFFEATGGYALAAFQDASSANHTSLELRSDGGSASNSRYLIRGYGNYSSSPTETYYVTSGGYQYLANNLIFASGSGIDFSATSGTGTSELFDDYEEGTWSPTYDDTGGTGSYTQDVSRGLYTKVGNKVTVHFEVRTDAVSGATGDAIITGLPFTPSGTNYNETGVGSVAALTIQGFTTQAPTACVASTSGNIELLYDNGGVTTNLPAANLATGANSNRLRGTVTYLIT